MGGECSPAVSKLHSLAAFSDVFSFIHYFSYFLEVQQALNCLGSPLCTWPASQGSIAESETRSCAETWLETNRGEDHDRGLLSSL